MGFRDFLSEFLPEEEIDAFAEWAVGENYKELHEHEWPEMWNKRHRNVLTIYPTGQPNKDILEMIKSWRENGSSTTSRTAEQKAAKSI